MDVYELISDQGIGAIDLLQDFDYSLDELYEIRDVVNELIKMKEVNQK